MISNVHSISHAHARAYPNIFSYRYPLTRHALLANIRLRVVEDVIKRERRKPRPDPRVVPDRHPDGSSLDMRVRVQRRARPDRARSVNEAARRHPRAVPERHVPPGFGEYFRAFPDEAIVAEPHRLHGADIALHVPLPRLDV